MVCNREPTVAVIIPCFRQAQFLSAAIESVLAQSVAPAEILVVDDGGEDPLLKSVMQYREVKLITQQHGGLASARNRGVGEARSNKLIFLDADDLLSANAIEAGLRCFGENPNASFVYGAHQELRDSCRITSLNRAGTRADFVRFNCVGMIASAMFDRAILLKRGGFDETLGMCEDWDLFLRLSRDSSFGVHDEVVATYVKHQLNMSQDVRAMRRWIGVVRAREKARGLTPEEQRAWIEGEVFWSAAYPLYTPDELARRLGRKLTRTFRRLQRA